MGSVTTHNPNSNINNTGVQDKWSRPILHVSIVILFCFLTYSNTLYNGFHLDDGPHILYNPGIETVSPMSRHFVDPSTMSALPEIRMYRPLLPLTFSLNYALHGHSPPGYHLVNMAFHSLAAVAVYLLCFELLGFSPSLEDRTRERRLLGWAVALVFVVHPVSGIPINYISGRDLIMMYLFLMSALYCYIRMDQEGPSIGRWMGVLVLFTLSLLSKQNAMVMPALIFIYEWVLKKRSWSDRILWLRVLPFAAIIIGLLAYIKLGLQFSDLGQVLHNSQLPSPWTYPLTQLKLHLFRYLPNFFWPWGIRESPFVELSTFSDPRSWIGLVFVLSTLFIAWRFRTKNPLTTFCILAYWIIFSPSSSVVPLLQMEFDYRAYPSSVFLYIILAVAAFQLLRPFILTLGMLVVLAYLSLAAHYFNQVWKNGLTLWGHSVAGGGSALAHNNFASANKDLDIREKHYRIAAEMSSMFSLARINLGLTLIKKGKKEEGLKMVEAGWEMDPRPGQNSYLLSVAYKMTGEVEKAIAFAVKTAKAVPIKHYLHETSFLLVSNDKHAEAIPFLEAILPQDPDYKFTGYLLALSYQKTGQPAKAIPTYQSYIQTHPEDYYARFNLAQLEMEANHCARAVEGFQKTLELKPDYHEAHQHLATCYQKMGNDAEAKKHATLWDRASPTKK